MKRTLFFLGRTPKLAFLELQTLFPSATLILSDIAEVSVPIDATETMRRVGGTVKIAELVNVTTALHPDAIATILESYAKDGRLSFGMSGYGESVLPPSYFRTVKKYFLDRGVHVRYIEPEHGPSLSSVVVAKQHITEVNIVSAHNEYLLSVTRAVQDFEDWNNRDAARPSPDPKHGMLPPKVARMIVNIALGAESQGKVLFDPFCGVGTILGEALLVGSRVVGSDTSAGAVARATKNIAWLRAEYGLLHEEKERIEVGDATHVSDRMEKESIDAIVTEPFMGSLVSDRTSDTVLIQQTKNTLKGLEKLYIGCLKDWSKVLRPSGKVVMALPQYHVQGRDISVKNVVDRCETYGYTLLTGPIEYSRPQAVVRREFYIFQKHGTR